MQSNTCFVILLSRHENNLSQLSNEWFAENFKQIRSQKHSSSHDSDSEGIGPQNRTFDPSLEEESFLRSRKRSIFYQWVNVMKLQNK